MKRLIFILAAALILLGPAFAEEQGYPLTPQRNWGDILKTLLARHKEWYAFDKISPNFIVAVPLGNGVAVNSTDGVPKQIRTNPDVVLHSIIANKDASIRGELRYMRKDGKTDVLSTFKDLTSQEGDVVDSLEKIKTGDRQKGIYILVFIKKNGDVVYEAIHNRFDDIAVSYRTISKKGSESEAVARSFVADYTLLRKCSQENLGDAECVKPTKKNEL